MTEKYLHYCAVTLFCSSVLSIFADNSLARPSFSPDGVVEVPAFSLPPSSLSSAEAQAVMKRRAEMSTEQSRLIEPDVNKARTTLAARLQPQVDDILAAYPVSIQETEVAGVPVRVFTPADGKVKSDRVLINLHGGAFQTCWESCSQIESAPIAVTGGYRVISVNYRMAPEAKHPAGVEDVAAVFSGLTEDYAPSAIGIYGCSAGGSLTAQAAAWMPAHSLPGPGAVGIFGAGGVRFGSGDSAFISGHVSGAFPAPALDGTQVDMTRGYFDAVDMADASVSPALHPEVVANFPPSLLITGTRAMDLSPAVYTNTQLLKAGVDSTLLVGEGMDHCFIYQNRLPEAREAYEIIADFFDHNLR
jgi:acetyl esterase/lipase